jgi:hypothetical protein
MTTVAVLSEALARGGKVVWDPPHKPRLLAPPSLHAAIRADRETVREVLRRATILREQARRFIQHGRPLPILALPNRPGGDGCLSCGAALDGGPYRCELCALAVKLALEEIP